MMGRSSQDQRLLFYSFNLEEVVPDDHLVRATSRVLDLAWVRAELARHYSHTGRPSIDPVLMIRMLIVGYVFAIRSERALCREVRLNLAYRWFCTGGNIDNITVIQRCTDTGAHPRRRSAWRALRGQWPARLVATQTRLKRQPDRRARDVE